jgi:hypothetical protein
MKEFQEIQSSKEPEFFEEIDNLSIEDKISVIQNKIIPLMNVRRGRKRDEYMNAAKIHEKLYRPAGTGKAGETIELLHESNRLDLPGIDKKYASELADLSYYGLQPNADEKDQLEYLLDRELVNFFVGIPIESILSFCILKYSTRLKFGDEPNYKEIEFKRLDEYLDIHPELTNLWNARCGSLPPRETIWEHVSG